MIGGGPRSGKTTVARALSEKIGVPYISTDYFRLVVMPYFKGDKMALNFPYEVMFDQYDSIHEFFAASGGNDLLEADLKESDVLWEGIEAFLEHMLMSDTDYIVEGFHLLPNFIEKYNDDENVKSVILYKKNVELIFDGLKANQNNDDWIASNINSDEVLMKAAESLSVYGKYFEDAISKYEGMNGINTEENFFERIDKVIGML